MGIPAIGRFHIPHSIKRLYKVLNILATELDIAVRAREETGDNCLSKVSVDQAFLASRLASQLRTRVKPKSRSETEIYQNI